MPGTFSATGIWLSGVWSPLCEFLSCFAHLLADWLTGKSAAVILDDLLRQKTASLKVRISNIFTFKTYLCTKQYLSTTMDNKCSKNKMPLGLTRNAYAFRYASEMTSGLSSSPGWSGDQQGISIESGALVHSNFHPNLNFLSWRRICARVRVHQMLINVRNAVPSMGCSLSHSRI